MSHYFMLRCMGAVIANRMVLTSKKKKQFYQSHSGLYYLVTLEKHEGGFVKMRHSAYNIG